MEEYAKLLALVADTQVDADKFFNKGNNAAGTRLRKALQEIKAQSQTVRLAVQTIKGEV
jgi:hypothetical protein